MAKRKTHKEYVLELEERNPNIEVVETYINADTKILHRCKIDGYEWSVKPSHILSGIGCPKCVGLARRTHDDYIKELLLKNPNIEVVGKYKNANTKIMHHCLIHDVYWNTTPTRALNGEGCSMCKSDKIKDFHRKSHEEYVFDVSIINENIEVIGTYINSNTPILHRCKIHDVIWKTTPSNIMCGVGCCKCFKEKVQAKLCKTHKQYVEDLEKTNLDIVVVDKYINSKTSILHKCKICGCEWYATPSHILSGRGCPQCQESSGERRIRLWLDENNIGYEYQKVFKDCKNILPLPFDFYLPEYNLCIEYDGRQHFEPIEYFGGEGSFKRRVEHDNIKTNYCTDNRILLLRIPYFKNVEEELNKFLFI